MDFQKQWLLQVFTQVVIKRTVSEEVQQHMLHKWIILRCFTYILGFSLLNCNNINYPLLLSIVHVVNSRAVVNAGIAW